MTTSAFVLVSASVALFYISCLTKSRWGVCRECGEALTPDAPPAEFGSMERKTLETAHSREVQIRRTGQEHVQVGYDNF